MSRPPRKVRLKVALGPITTCPTCEKRVRRNNLDRHMQGALCFVRCVDRDYRAMGWVPAEGYGRVIAGAGLDAELVPTGIVTVDVACAPEPWRSRATKGWVDVPSDAWWAPARSVHLAKLLALTRLSRLDRAEALRVMLADPELSAAVASARLLGDSVAVAALVRGALLGRAMRKKSAPK